MVAGPSYPSYREPRQKRAPSEHQAEAKSSKSFLVLFFKKEQKKALRFQKTKHRRPWDARRIRGP
jgi:hypothetical protein